MSDLRDSFYRCDEIKFKIDTAIQFIMFEDKEQLHWDAILQVQERLYEEFGFHIE